MARPTPVLPDVGSTIVPPGRRSPAFSAASTMATAGRSFTLPPALRNSALASRWQSSRRPTRSRRTSGVLPTRSSSESATSMAGPVSVSGRIRSPSGSARGGVGVEGDVEAVGPQLGGGRRRLRPSRGADDGDVLRDVGPHVRQQLGLQLRTDGVQHPIGPHHEPLRRLGLAHHHQHLHTRTLRIAHDQATDTPVSRTPHIPARRQLATIDVANCRTSSVRISRPAPRWPLRRPAPPPAQRE